MRKGTRLAFPGRGSGLRLFGYAILIFCLAPLMRPAMAQQGDPRKTVSASSVDRPEAEGIRDVRIGLYLLDLVEVVGPSQSFLADVMMVANWTDPALAGAFETTRTVAASEVWSPHLLVANERSINRSLPENVAVDPDGRVQYVQRFLGTFSASMDLSSFPLDRQRLTVWVVAPLKMGDAVNLIVDDSFASLRNDHLSIGDWSVGRIELVERDFQTTAVGTPAPGVELSVEVKRRITYYVIQIIVPLLAIMLMAWTVFWIAPSTINVRVSVSVTTMLTLIAYRFALASHVPKLSYLTRLDWFLLGATVLVMLTLGTMAYSAHLVKTGREGRVQQIDRYGRVFYPAAVVGYTLIVWLAR